MKIDLPKWMKMRFIFEETQTRQLEFWTLMKVTHILFHVTILLLVTGICGQNGILHDIVRKDLIGREDPSPTTASSSPSVNESPSPSISPTPDLISSADESASPSVTPSCTPSPVSISPTPSKTSSPSRTPSPIFPSSSASKSCIPSGTPTNTSSATLTPTRTPTVTSTPSTTPSITLTPFEIPSSSITPTPSVTPSRSITPSPTSSSSPSITPSLYPSSSPSRPPQMESTFTIVELRMQGDIGEFDNNSFMKVLASILEVPTSIIEIMETSQKDFNLRIKIYDTETTNSEDLANLLKQMVLNNDPQVQQAGILDVISIQALDSKSSKETKENSFSLLLVVGVAIGAVILGGVIAVFAFHRRKQLQEKRRQKRMHLADRMELQDSKTATMRLPKEKNTTVETLNEPEQSECKVSQNNQ